MQDFGKGFLPAASTSACRTVAAESACLLPGENVLVQELPVHRAVPSCGFKGEDVVPVDRKDATVISSHVPGPVSGSKPVRSVKAYPRYRLDRRRVQRTCNARKDSPFLSYLRVSYVGQPLWGETIHYLPNPSKPLKTMPSIQVHSICST